MKIEDILYALERFAPLPLQDDYDNSGLQMGLTEVEATGALLCLDVTEDVVDEAVSLGINLILSHHPLLFKGVKCIDGYSSVGRCILKAAKHGIVLYAAHTNLDNAWGGVSFVMADKLGMTDVRVLQPHSLLDATSDHHSGAGVIGRLPEPMDEVCFLQHVKSVFDVPLLRHGRLTGRFIDKVALCGGAGAFLASTARDMKADVFLTGEIKYHEYQGYDGNMLLVETGHYESEQFTVDLLGEILKQAFPELNIHRTTKNTNPIKYM